MTIFPCKSSLWLLCDLGLVGTESKQGQGECFLSKEGSPEVRVYESISTGLSVLT